MGIELLVDGRTPVLLVAANGPMVRSATLLAYPARRRLAQVTLAVVAVVLAASLAEAVARWTDPPRRLLPLEAALHAELSPELRAGLASFLDDREAVWWREPTRWRYEDYHLYRMAPIATGTIRFHEDTGARDCPDGLPSGADVDRVWFFGGSTMQDLGAPDRLTVANQTIKTLNDGGQRVRGLNFGTTSYQSGLELIRFQGLLRSRRAEEHPKVAIFYDGYNDAVHAFTSGAGRVQITTRAGLQALVEHDDGPLLRHVLARWLGHRSVFARRLVAPLLEPAQMATSPPPDLSPDNLTRAVAAYLTNVKLIRAVARDFGVRPLFVLQPLVVTKQGLGPVDQRALANLPADRRAFVLAFYDGVRAALADAPGFVDLSAALDHDGRSDFRDLGHTSLATGPTLGAALARAVRPLLDGDGT